jgi:hypothetical protein
MAPTFHHISPSTTFEQRRPDRRSGHRRPVLGIRSRVHVPHARLTYAESPELYLREEMC